MTDLLSGVILLTRIGQKYPSKSATDKKSNTADDYQNDHRTNQVEISLNRYILLLLDWCWYRNV